MKPIYKAVKDMVEHCPKCGERLGGNNSIARPWTCSCGTWEAVHHPFRGEYQIIPRR